MSRQPYCKCRPSWLWEALGSLILVATTGCQHYAKITWEPPVPVEVAAKTPLAVADLAELRRKGGVWDADPTEAVIGKHTFTVFAIPVGSVNTHQSTPLKQTFAAAVCDALEAAGYELVPASEAPDDAPVLRGEVNACWWWSYSYFWPVVIQGGENKVSLVLETRDGTPLWQREFSRIEPGVTPGGAYALDLMIKWSMTKLVRDMARECSSEAFKAALQPAVSARSRYGPAEQATTAGCAHGFEETAELQTHGGHGLSAG
jgi:hypothetical protein